MPWAELLDLLVKLASLLLLGYGLRQTRMNTKYVLDTVEKTQKEIPGKRALIKQAQWDFNILFLSILVVASGLLDLIEKQVFTVFLTGIAAALGVKSVSELKKED